MQNLKQLKENWRRLAEPQVLIRAVLLSFLLIIWGVIISVLNLEYDTTKNSAYASARDLRKTYEAQMEVALREIDKTLQFVKYEFELNEKWIALSDLERNGLLLPKNIFTIDITDDLGTIVASSHPAGAALNVAQYEFFREARRDNSLSITQAQFDQRVKQWRLCFSRRINSASGQFAGVVIVSVAPSYFVENYETSRFGSQGVLGLLDKYGKFIVRRTGDKVFYGEDAKLPLTFQKANQAAPVTLIKNAWDQGERFTAAHSIASFPAAVVIGLSKEEQFATVYASIRTYLIWAVLFSVVLVLVAVALSKLNTQLEQSRARTAQAQAELLNAARQAGMAEIATNVLHNVGNVLNSLNVSTRVLQDKLVQSKLDRLAKVVSLFKEHKEDLGSFITQHEQGKVLPVYLDTLGNVLAEEQLQIKEELGQLSKGISHIAEIVSAQQSYAKSNSIVKLKLNVNELVEDAIRLSTNSNANQVKIIKELGVIPPVQIDKSRSLQILANLIRNAMQALEKSSNEPLIILRTALHVNAQGTHILRVEVEDKGCGIAPENLTKIFAHGFTTREDGHGFGLHSAVNAAKEMQGSLNVHSAGIGKGAIFILEVPVDSENEYSPRVVEPA